MGLEVTVLETSTRGTSSVLPGSGWTTLLSQGSERPYTTGRWEEGPASLRKGSSSCLEAGVQVAVLFQSSCHRRRPGMCQGVDAVSLSTSVGHRH